MKKKYEVIHNRAKINIGKKGLNDNIIQEIINIIKKDGFVKIKINKNFYYECENKKEGRNSIINTLTEKGFKVVDVRGNTITITLKQF